jgi:hypothetical protein
MSIVYLITLHTSYPIDSGIRELNPTRTAMIGDFWSARPAPPLFFAARTAVSSSSTPESAAS